MIANPSQQLLLRIHQTREMMKSGQQRNRRSGKVANVCSIHTFTLYNRHAMRMLCSLLIIYRVYRRAYRPGVGVHRIWFKSFSFADEPPCQFDVLSIASDLLEAIVLFNSLFAAGVRFPTASALFGVHVGGPIFPRVRSDVRDIPGVLPPPNRIAFARRLFEAFAESLCEMRSRLDGPAMRNGVLGSGTSAGSSEVMIRGVASSVPQVMSCLTAAGPNSSGVGEGIAGTSPNPSFLGELGLSAM